MFTVILGQSGLEATLVLFFYVNIGYELELRSKLYVSIFFTFNYTNVKHLRGNRKYADLPHVTSPMSVALCHPASITSNHFIDYMCFPSPYHAAIIKLQNKQYYLFIYFLELSKSVSPKVITDTLSIFQNIIHVNSENMNVLECCWA